MTGGEPGHRRAAILAALAPAARGSTLRIRLTGLAAVWLAIAALGAQSASALAPGYFSPTGSMTVPRTDAAASPLPDGRVLVAGGESFVHLTSDFLQSAEIFDPATGTFSPTGDLTVQRTDAAASALPDGRVLVAGGGTDTSSAGDLQSAEIFDPASGTFSPTGDLTVPRRGAAAAPLPDGRVLVAGGGHFDPSSPSGFVALRSAEIFDPATNSFSSAGIGSMSVQRLGAAAAPLPDGRVLVAGGLTDSPFAGDLQSAEVFDPATGTFSPTGDLTVPRRGAAAAPLPDGRVLVAGGRSNPASAGDLHSAEIFDPATGSFSPTAPTTAVHWGGTVASPLPDGRVLVAGGAVGFSSTSSAELFTPALSRKLRRTKLTARVAVAGTLTAADAKGRRGSLKRSSASGGPGPITLKLRPATRSKRRFERKGKLKVRARLGFVPAPVRGGCVTLTGPCYSSGYAITETATLTLKAKKRR